MYEVEVVAQRKLTSLIHVLSGPGVLSLRECPRSLALWLRPAGFLPAWLLLGLFVFVFVSSVVPRGLFSHFAMFVSCVSLLWFGKWLVEVDNVNDNDHLYSPCNQSADFPQGGVCLGRGPSLAKNKTRSMQAKLN